MPPEGSLVLLAEVARALRTLLDRVVFIGGAVAPLLQVDRPFGAARPTVDVDAIAITASYLDFDRLREALRQLGFREQVDAGHANRWITPGARAVKFDLVPIGEHLGASGNPWDSAALETATSSEIEAGLTIRHASAPGFLALKFAAYRDRGAEDPATSTDLEDIFALLASRPQIVEEVSDAPPSLRNFVAERAALLLELDEFEDLIAGHLGNVARDRAGEVIPATEDRLRQIAAG